MKSRIYTIITFVLVTLTNILQAQTWKEVNPPPNIFNNSILSISTDSVGNLYAAGKFKNINNEYVVAKWNGSSWAELGAGNNALKAKNAINAIVIGASGNIYAAGSFTNTTGNISIVKWNGASWSELGGTINPLNPNGTVYAMTSDQQGNIYAAGSFTDSSGNGYVAKWNGTTWSRLGFAPGILKGNDLIYSLTTAKSGGVYAAGRLTNAINKYCVAKWNNSTWEELGGAVPLNANDYITCINTDNTGNVYAGGAFRNTAGDYYIAKWNGVDWAEVGSGTNTLKANGPINEIVISGAGMIYAGGFGTNTNGNTNLVYWNGTSWNEVTNFGYAINSTIHTICLDKSGNVYTAGDFKNSGAHNYVAKWDGDMVGEVGGSGTNLKINNGIYNIAVDSKRQVYATGNFGYPTQYIYIAHWNGKTWKELGGDSASLRFTDYLNVSMTTDLSGNLYVGGNFTNQNGKHYIAKWDGTAWSELGDPANPIKIYESISLLTTDKAGNVYAAGAFGDGDGYRYTIMKWDGASWYLYPYLQGAPSSLFVDNSGNIFAGNTTPDENGKYYVEKINTNGVTRLGTGANALNSATKITAIAVDRNGNVLASGLNNAGYSPHNKFVAKWDGTTWSTAGANSGTYADGYVSSMIADNAGNVYAASATNGNGYFSVAKWDGNNWNELGPHYFFNSNVHSIAKDVNGNVYAGGLFGNTYGEHYVALYGKSASWVGGVNNLWNNPNNWSNGLVPDQFTDVTINNGIECIVSTPGICRTLTLSPGSKLTVNSTLDVLQ